MSQKRIRGGQASQDFGHFAAMRGANERGGILGELLLLVAPTVVDHDESGRVLSADAASVGYDPLDVSKPPIYVTHETPEALAAVGFLHVAHHP